MKHGILRHFAAAALLSLSLVLPLADAIAGASNPPAPPTFGVINNNPAALKKWRAALADARNGVANASIAFVGDSTWAGYNSSAGGSDSRATSAPSRLSALLNTYFAPAESDSFFGDVGEASTTAYAAYDPRVGFGSGWVAGSFSSLGGRPFGNNSTVNPLTFATGNQADTCDVWTSAGGGTGSQLSLDFDGGTAATTTLTAGAAMQKATITGTLGTHTLNIKRGASAGTSSLYIYGADCYNSAVKKVQIWNLGRGGWKASDWADTSSSVAPLNALQVIAPKLTLINLGINDWVAGTPIASYIASMQAIITAAQVSGDVLLVGPVPSASSTTTLDTQAQYIAAIYGLAGTNNVPLVDYTARWTSYEVSQPLGFYSGTLHPNMRGYADMAQALVRPIALPRRRLRNERRGARRVRRTAARNRQVGCGQRGAA